MKPGDQNPHRYRGKSRISLTLATLIAAGAGTGAIYHQLLAEKEGVRLQAYQDGVGIWTICTGLTRIYGRPVVKGDKLSRAQCVELDQAEQDKGLEEMRRMVNPAVWEGLSPAARAGLASWCVHNIGASKCRTSTALRRLNAGDRNDACAAITLWIKDQGKDCRERKNGCFGQVERRQLEDELCLIGGTK